MISEMRIVCCGTLTMIGFPPKSNFVPPMSTVELRSAVGDDVGAERNASTERGVASMSVSTGRCNAPPSVGT